MYVAPRISTDSNASHLILLCLLSRSRHHAKFRFRSESHRRLSKWRGSRDKSSISRWGDAMESTFKPMHSPRLMFFSGPEMVALDREMHCDKSTFSSLDDSIGFGDSIEANAALCSALLIGIVSFNGMGSLILIYSNSLQPLNLSVLKRGQNVARPYSVSSKPSPSKLGEKLKSRISNDGQFGCESRRSSPRKFGQLRSTKVFSINELMKGFSMPLDDRLR
mmetsp:Transcript_19030/g.40142  ORF Transcript_19030/g.40142 Transcript_19030/m.40142 type:complete len:221 (+) Transcript_19030:392-1054(+)